MFNKHTGCMMSVGCYCWHFLNQTQPQPDLQQSAEPEQQDIQQTIG